MIEQKLQQTLALFHFEADNALGPPVIDEERLLSRDRVLADEWMLDGGIFQQQRNEHDERYFEYFGFDGLATDRPAASLGVAGLDGGAVHGCQSLETFLEIRRESVVGFDLTGCANQESKHTCIYGRA